MLHPVRLLFVVAGVSLHAQQDNPKLPPVRETITVVGAAEPVTEGESSRAVETIDVQSHPAFVTEPAAYLRMDPSVDIQMRGPMGVQSDVSIRGGSFEQTLVLLNGLRINDAETSHFNLDVPVPLQAIGSINVLHGTGSTLYGSDAVAGVVDLRTWKPETSSLRLRAGYGSYGIQQQSFLAAGVRGKASEVLSGNRDFSTGFITDRDYRSESLSSETRVDSAFGTSDILLAASDRAFGADQFYGNYPSWERTKGWFTSWTQSFDPKTQAAFAWRRHSDVYTLIRSNPATYQNNHIDQSWQATVRRKDTLGHHVSLFYGLEENADSIHSNSLGQHGRNRGAGYADLDLRWQRASLSVGLREEVIGGYGVVSIPSVSGAVWAMPSLKLRGSVGHGFRQPTYVDLYYSDPTTISNPLLKPESSWSYDGGADWYLRDHLSFSVTGFTSKQNNAIDYVRPDAMAKYQAQNLTGFQFTGVETSLRANLSHAQQLRISWTYLSGVQDALQGRQSLYLFNYPVNNTSAEWIATLKQVAVRSRLGVTQRYQRTAYPVLDLSAAREKGFLRPYLQLTNLTNTGYQEISGVRMQGRAFIGGLEFVLR